MFGMCMCGFIGETAENDNFCPSCGRTLSKARPLEVRNVTEDLCKACGQCCVYHVLWTGKPVDSAGAEAYKDFLRMRGLNVIELQRTVQGVKGQYIGIDLGRCQFLRESKVGEVGSFQCRIYDKRPQICRDYNCCTAPGHDRESVWKFACRVFSQLENRKTWEIKL